jgi:hypothetical protein
MEFGSIDEVPCPFVAHCKIWCDRINGFSSQEGGIDGLFFVKYAAILVQIPEDELVRATAAAISIVRDGADKGVAWSRSPSTHGLVVIWKAFFIGVRRPKGHRSRPFKDFAQLSGRDVVYQDALCIGADGQQPLIRTNSSIVASVFALRMLVQIGTEVKDVARLRPIFWMTRGILSRNASTFEVSCRFVREDELSHEVFVRKTRHIEDNL